MPSIATSAPPYDMTRHWPLKEMRSHCESAAIQDSYGHSKVVLPSGIVGTVLPWWAVSIAFLHWLNNWNLTWLWFGCVLFFFSSIFIIWAFPVPRINYSGQLEPYTKDVRCTIKVILHLMMTVCNDLNTLENMAHLLSKYQFVFLKNTLRIPLSLSAWISELLEVSLWCLQVSC